MAVNKIPRTIHYCWFGNNLLSESSIKCINSWKKYCPDYEIIEWNENNFDINICEFTKNAYNNKNYAFVSDYARLYIIYNNGGIYLDTDVELLKNLDILLGNKSFFGFEGSEYINPGLGFGAIKGFNIINEILSFYNNLDYNSLSRIENYSIPIITTNILLKYGLKKNGEYQILNNEIKIYPEDFFCPKNPITRLLNITENIYSIHHYDASWVNDEEKLHIKSLDEKAYELMKMQSKRVSIVIPVYNGENYLHEAIQSALNQTYKNIEIIVINDGSTDKTEEIALSYGNKIRYFNKDNGGVASALNFGIQKMRGEYFSWLSHDDKYYPEKIEKQVACATSLNDDNAIIVSNWTIIDENSNIVKKQYIDKKIERKPKCFLAFDRNTWLNGCAMLIPKSIFFKYGIFDEKLKTTQDYDLWLRLSDEVKFHILEDHLLYSRAHSKQGSLSEPDALINSDIFHFNIIKDLKQEEIFNYFDKNNDNCLQAYYSFLHNGYKKTPAIIITKIIKMLFNEGNIESATKLIDQEILGNIPFNNYYLNKISIKKEKNNILFIGSAWYTGGVERTLSNLFKYLNKFYNIFLITFKTDYQSSIAIPEYVTHIEVSNEVFHSSIDYSLIAISLLFNIDIAIGCFNLFSSVLEFYKHSYGVIKTIAFNNEYYFYPLRNSYFYSLFTERFEAYKYVNASVWLTNFSNYVHNTHFNNGYYIPNSNTFKIQDNELNNNKNIICIGRFNDHVKRVDRILKSFSILEKKDPDAVLYLIGKYDLEAQFLYKSQITMNEIINELKIPRDKIVFVNETTKVDYYYSIASVLLITSETEGFPMIINEAACYGVPTVCNHIPGIEDIIINGENGYIVPQDDLNLMADKLYDILNSNDLRYKLFINSKKLAERYILPTVGEKWKILIDNIINNNYSNLQEYFKNNSDLSIINKYSQYLFDEIKLLMKNISNDKINIEQLNNIINDKNIEINQLNQNINNLYSQIEQLNNNIANAQIAQLTNELNNFYNSKSWRITKPLRWGKKFLVTLFKYGPIVTAKKVVNKVKGKVKKYERYIIS